MKVTKFGPWAQAGATLQALSVNIAPAYKAQLREDGELFLETVQGHIDSQDLPWPPLASQTVSLKGGSETVYVESGYLRDNLEVRVIRSSQDGLTLFVGASPWKRHPSGEKLSDIMIWLEYGTDRIPPRPLIRPSWEEVEPIIKQHWQELIADLVTNGGR